MSMTHSFAIEIFRAKTRIIAESFFNCCNFYFLTKQVLAVVCVDDPAEVDRLSFDLPIMKKMGDRVRIECRSIRPVEEWVEDLKKLAED